jgi:hypothetical protein
MLVHAGDRPACKVLFIPAALLSGLSQTFIHPASTRRHAIR